MSLKYIETAPFSGPSCSDFLYYIINNARCLDSGARRVDGGLFVTEGEVLSFDTFFSALYESLLRKSTNIESVELEVEVVGGYTLEVFRVAGDSVDLLHSHAYEGNSPRLAIDLIESISSSRLFFTITPNADAVFKRSIWRVSGGGFSVPRVLIGICTFNNERYCAENVKRILNCIDTDDDGFDLLIVNNGNTLEDDVFRSPRVRVIEQANIGGSGGFGRCIYEMMSDGGSFSHATHLLLMDDDIHLDVSMLNRLRALLAYSPANVSYGGALIDLESPSRVYEVCPIYNKTKPLSLLSDSSFWRDYKSLATRYSKVHEMSYNGWWFACYSREVLKKIGMPLPFFIKRDDVDFGLRASQHSTLRTAPGLGVWHRAFSSRGPSWTCYYEDRNDLILSLIDNRSFSLRDIFKRLKKTLFGYFFNFDYASVAALLLAISDVFELSRGPVDSVNTRTIADIHKELQRRSVTDLKPVLCSKLEKTIFGLYVKISNKSPRKFLRRSLRMRRYYYSGKPRHEDFAILDSLNIMQLGYPYTIHLYDPPTHSYKSRSYDAYYEMQSVQEMNELFRVLASNEDAVRSYWRSWGGHWRTREAWSRYLSASSRC